MLNRRHLLKGTLGTLGAALGAFALRGGNPAPETATRGTAGQPMGEMATLVQKNVAVSGPTISITGPHAGDEGFVVSNMTLVSGPDPDTMVHVILHKDGSASVLPSWDALPPDEVHRMMAIPRRSFAEFDPAYGVVTLTNLRPINESMGTTDLVIRIAYLREIYRRYPELAAKADRERRERWDALGELLDDASIWPGDYTAPLLR